MSVCALVHVCDVSVVCTTVDTGCVLLSSVLVCPPDDLKCSSIRHLFGTLQVYIYINICMYIGTYIWVYMCRYNNKSQLTRDYLRCITVPRRKKHFSKIYMQDE